MTSIGSYSKKERENSLTVGKQYQSLSIILAISLLLFGGIGWRLSYLQLDRGKINLAKAENNRIRIVPKPPVRGSILDRQGKILATTRLSHSAYLWPKAQKQENWLEIKALLAQILAIPASELQQRVESAGYNYPSLIPIARNLSPAQVTAIEEYRPQLQWVEVDIDKVRYYPQKNLAAHILGYTGELDREELALKKPEGYRLGDVTGKMGVEAAYEHLLRGEWGGLKLEVDGTGSVLSFLGERPARSGRDITLTVDAKVQQAAEAALGTQKGAIAALDPNNGAVLAMASYPSFDPNIFSSRVTPEIWQELQAQGNPFLNLALRGFPRFYF